MIGRTLSHYKVLEEISRGGMGIVYRAVDVKLDREVALKVLPPELVADPQRRSRFIQEARAASKLEHPHIAVIHEIDEAEGVTFIAMELIRGEKLRDAMARERLPLARSLELAVEVVEGLARAHDKGIVHRDLKPANIMVTEDGHAKIIDFGLAKLIEPLEGAGSEVATLLQKEPLARAQGERSESRSESARGWGPARQGKTDPGIIMGTVSYMSPEQARGGKVDHRSDVFSFAIVLYEMLTGHNPFQRGSAMDTLSAILKDPAPRLPALGPEVTADAASDLQRIVDKCLTKEPADRYQGMRDLVVDLRAARRRLESGSLTPARPRPGGWILAGAVATMAILLAVGGALLFLRPATRSEAPTSSSKPSLAVLYFENNTGDSSFDWLRTALTNMLVTDLSQSPQVEVLGTDRLYQILKEMNRLEERVTSFEVVQKVAERANVTTVLLGDFVKAGDNIRISVRLQEARSGKVLTSEKVEGVGESSIFPMVDDLTRRIKTRFDIREAADAELDRDLKDVTTSSVEAYRYYAEGINLHERLKEEEAIPLLEKAVALDPGFAMALAKLSVIHANLGHPKQTDEYARQAIEHVERLTARERAYIEGRYYSNREETQGRAIEIYEKALKLYPDHSSVRGNLANRYAAFERYDEAIQHAEELRRRGYTFAGTYGTLAVCYSERGELGKGDEVLQDILRWSPENAAAHRYLGFHLIRWGKLDEALQAFQRLSSLAPGSLWPDVGRGQICLLREQWSEAQRAAQKVAASPDPFWKWVGSINLTNTRLYQGRSREALVSVERAARAYPEPGVLSAQAHGYAAQVLLESDQPARGLEQARRAQVDGKGDLGEWWGLFYAALSEARLGRSVEAERTADELRRKAESLPTEKEKRRYHHLAGELALARGDIARAIDALTKAQSTLPPRGFPGGGGPAQHVPIWFSLGSAHLASGGEEKAAEYFRRVAESTNEHMDWPIPYVRSFYFLGKIHEMRGDTGRAREYYRRFLGFWKDGDLDRERVEEVKRKI